jgi:hypothetical protein
MVRAALRCVMNVCVPTSPYHLVCCSCYAALINSRFKFVTGEAPAFAGQSQTHHRSDADDTDVLCLQQTHQPTIGLVCGHVILHGLCAPAINPALSPQNHPWAFMLC